MAKRTCSNLGGEMIMAVGKDFDHSIGDPSLCKASHAWGGKQVVWIPVTLDSKSKETANQWIYNKKPLKKHQQKWAKSQPNGYGAQQCVAVWQVPNGTHVWYDADCLDKYCSICAIPAVQTFYLRGSVTNGISNDIDQKYSLLMEMQNSIPKLVFEGQRGLSQIAWFPIKEEMVIYRYDDKEGQHSVRLQGNPFGFGLNDKRDWIFTNVVY